MPINRIYADGHTLYRVMRQPVIYKKINVWSQPDLRSSDATRCIHNLHLPPENFKWLILIKIEKCGRQEWEECTDSAAQAALSKGGSFLQFSIIHFLESV